MAGIALIGLGIACWPGPPLIGMLTYSATVALYLAYLGLAGGFGGVLLWPAVILHLVLTALLAKAPRSLRLEQADLLLRCSPAANGSSRSDLVRSPIRPATPALCALRTARVDVKLLLQIAARNASIGRTPVLSRVRPL